MLSGKMLVPMYWMLKPELRVESAPKVFHSTVLAIHSICTIALWMEVKSELILMVPADCLRSAVCNTGTCQTS